MEIDGYFRMGKFEVNMFDYNEIEVLFSNVKKEEEKYYIYCIIEAKLGANKVDELIKQIRKDHNLLKMKDINNTILIGFINSIKIKDRNHLNSLGKKKCVIYGIKNSIFCGKEVTYQIDWELEKRVNNIEKVFNDLKPKINKIYDYIIRKEKKESKQQKGDKDKEEETRIKIKGKEHKEEEKEKKEGKKKKKEE